MQNGSLIETKRRNGQSVWEFRWRDRTSGKAVYRRIVVGTIEQFKTAADIHVSFSRKANALIDLHAKGMDKSASF